jgi:hypothetical protein
MDATALHKTGQREYSLAEQHTSEGKKVLEGIFRLPTLAMHVPSFHFEVLSRSVLSGCGGTPARALDTKNVTRLRALL